MEAIGHYHPKLEVGNLAFSILLVLMYPYCFPVAQKRWLIGNSKMPFLNAKSHFQSTCIQPGCFMVFACLMIGTSPFGFFWGSENRLWSLKSPGPQGLGQTGMSREDHISYVINISYIYHIRPQCGIVKSFFIKL